MFSKLCILRYFPKVWLKFGEKASDQACFDGIDEFCKYFFFLYAAFFIIRENSPDIHGLRKIVFMKP